MDDLDSEWRRKGATLSDKTAQEEFGLTREESSGQSARGGCIASSSPCTETPGFGFFGEKWKRSSRKSMAPTT
jgi:hypothetical protein